METDAFFMFAVWLWVTFWVMSIVFFLVYLCVVVLQITTSMLLPLHKKFLESADSPGIKGTGCQLRQNREELQWQSVF